MKRFGDHSDGKFSWIPAMVCVLILVVAGCVSPVVAPEVTGDVPDNFTYYFLAANNADPFYVDGIAGFEAAAAELGVKTEFVGPMDLNLASQMKTFEELVNNPTTGGIFWYAMDFNAGEPMVKEAESRGIPVVIGAADSPFRTRSAFIGYDNTVLGEQAADVAAALIGQKGRVGSIGVTGPGVVQRREAFENRLREAYPEIEVVQTASHTGSADDAAKVLDAYMIANPDLALLWWADGAASQMVQPWREQRDAGTKTLFMATDMPQATLEAVRDGVFVATVAQDTFTESFWGMRMLYAKKHGIRVPDTVFLGAMVLYQETVQEFIKK